MIVSECAGVDGLEEAQVHLLVLDFLFKGTPCQELNAAIYWRGMPQLAPAPPIGVSVARCPATGLASPRQGWPKALAFVDLARHVYGSEIQLDRCMAIIVPESASSVLYTAIRTEGEDATPQQRHEQLHAELNGLFCSSLALYEDFVHPPGICSSVMFPE